MALWTGSRICSPSDLNRVRSGTNWVLTELTELNKKRRGVAVLDADLWALPTPDCMVHNSVEDFYFGAEETSTCLLFCNVIMNRLFVVLRFPYLFNVDCIPPYTHTYKYMYA